MAKYYVKENSLGTFWYKDSEMKILHRDGGPAVDWADGNKVWHKDGKFHREDGPAVEYSNGGKEWYKEGKLHREGGPAVELANGDKSWYIDGKYHREDGPAIELATLNTVSYWLNGGYLTKQQWEEAVRPVEELTVGQIEQLLGKRVKIIK